MISKFSLKKKLLIYMFFIQLSILIIFSLSLHKALEISTLDKLESTLKVIILDVVDDILEHEDLENLEDFDEEKEYKFEPLYIKLIKIDTKISTIKSINFPEDIKEDFNVLKTYNIDTIIFENQKPYIISRLKFILNNSEYIIEIATSDHTLNTTLENLLYILFFIIPIVLILATLGGYFLIYKSFLPIENILKDLKNITAKDLSKRLIELNIENDEINLLSKEINFLLSRIEVSFKKIEQFSSDASHELKTPLTIIRGEIEIALRKDRTITEYKESLESCLDEVLIIQKTIDDLLFLAKAEEQFAASLEEVYLDEIILESGKELEKFSILKKVKLEYKIGSNMQILGHSELIKVAIKNIIKNAIIFSNKNSKVVIKNYINKKDFVICVEDKGIGIPLSEQNKIFNNFFRTDKSRNKNTGGSGLGLSICKKIVDMHNGKILIESQEDIGTTIKIIFLKEKTFN